MKASLIAAALSLVAALPAQAHCKKEPMPTVLDAIVVTPNGAYTLAEYEARMQEREHLEQTKVTLAPVVVTPSDPSGDAGQTDVAQNAASSTNVHAPVRASSAPASPMQQPSLIKFLRKLLF